LATFSHGNFREHPSLLKNSPAGRARNLHDR
jgi:hypothetical protein